MTATPPRERAMRRPGRSTSCRRLPVVVALPVLVAACATQTAVEIGLTPQGHRYEVARAGARDAARLERDSVRYAFSLRTVAAGSGAYVAGVELSVVDESGAPVFDRRLDGPWVLLELPPGRYRCIGRLGDETERFDVDVPSRGRRSVVLYFAPPGPPGAPAPAS